MLTAQERHVRPYHSSVEIRQQYRVDGPAYQLYEVASDFALNEQPAPQGLRVLRSSASCNLLQATAPNSTGAPQLATSTKRPLLGKLRFWKSNPDKKRKRSNGSVPPPTSRQDSFNVAPTTPTKSNMAATEFRLQQRATMPPSPSSDRKPGFFKRHLSRRSSHMSPASTPEPSRALQSPPQAGPSPPSTVVRTPSPTAHAETLKIMESGPEAEPASPNGLLSPEPHEDNESIDESRSAKGVKWAVGFGDDTEFQSRPRRASSTGTNRRSSIYSRSPAGGDFLEGVDAGVGSKARKLSSFIPDDLDVEECRLEERFSFIQRHNQKEVGFGGAAVVKTMKGKTTCGGKEKLVAVKEFRPWEPQDEEQADYVRKIKSEYAIAKSCQHPNIVETFCLCYSKDSWYHVMEMCELGDLTSLAKKKDFSLEDKCCMFKQLLRGIDYLHSRGIAHRDIKSDNLLVTATGCLKIADFGTGECFSGKHPGSRQCRRQSLIDPDEPIRLCEPGQVGSRPYIAPEIMQRAPQYDPRGVDVWSSAIVFMSLCAGGTPWDCARIDCKNYRAFNDSFDEFLTDWPDGEIIKGRPLPAVQGSYIFNKLRVDAGTKRLLFGMLHPDPTLRWTAKQALESAVVVDFACCQQDGYSDDIKTRQKKSLHNHVPPKEKTKLLKVGG